MNCAEKLIRFSLESKRIAEYLRLTKEESDLISIPNHYAHRVIINRLDAFFDSRKKEIKFLEFNADSPGGTAYTDVMAEIYLKLPIFQIIKENYPYRFSLFHTRKHLLKSLLDCYYRSGGKKKRPVIALIGWDNIKIKPEFFLIREYFEKKGYETLMANPRSLEYKKNRLLHEDKKIDIVYKKVLTPQIIKNTDNLKGLIRAMKDNKTCFVNPVNSFLLSFKGILALFHDSEYDFLFTKREKGILSAVIPWTRKLEPCKAEYKGKKRDLLDYITKNKDRFVLKPCDGFGAEGVCIGSETDSSSWERAIRKGLKTRYVVQEKIKLPHETFPLSTSSPSFSERNLNLGLYALGGRYAGGILRFSSSSIINAVGGGALPIIRVGEK